MIATQPNVDPAGLYNQSQTARALGVSRSTVSRYEAKGILRFKVRRTNFKKVTTGAQILSCWRAVF